KFLALHAEPLVLRQMPVKNIHLDRGHAIEIPLQYIQWHEVATYIDHQSAPGKSWVILNRHCRHSKTIRGGLHQLQESPQPVHDPKRRCGVKLSASRADFK